MFKDVEKTIKLHNIKSLNTLEFLQKIEEEVSKYVGKKWSIETFKDFFDLASHFCGVFSGCNYSVFTKFYEGENSRDVVNSEIHGLNTLKNLANINIPNIIGTIQLNSGVVIIQEAVNEVPRNKDHWFNYGQTLARIHSIKSEKCGLEMDNYFGPIFQTNTQLINMVDFYAQTRLIPRTEYAISLGKLPKEFEKKIYKIIDILPQYCKGVLPSLLHGDAQKNNFISTNDEIVIIDPSVHYGHPEFDLSLVDYFEPIPNDFYDGYNSITLIENGFLERKDFWRISAWLAVVIADESNYYYSNLMNCVEKYI